jgi:hypothetical protein
LQTVCNAWQHVPSIAQHLLPANWIAALAQSPSPAPMLLFLPLRQATAGGVGVAPAPVARTAWVTLAGCRAFLVASSPGLFRRLGTRFGMSGRRSARQRRSAWRRRYWALRGWMARADVAGRPALLLTVRCRSQ